MTTPSTYPLPYPAEAKAYVKGRLEYLRFMRQVDKLQEQGEVSSTHSFSVLDFYPTEQPFNSLEKGKISILSFYDQETEDEELGVGKICNFLTGLLDSSLLPQVQWSIVAKGSDLELINMLVSYALLAQSIESEKAEESSKGSTGTTPDMLGLESQIEIIDVSEFQEIWLRDRFTYDVFWDGLGNLETLRGVSGISRMLLPGLDLPETEPSDLEALLLASWSTSQSRFLSQAQALLQEEQWQIAEEYCHAALRYWGSSADAWHTLAVIYLRQSQYYHADLAVQVSINLDPLNAVYYYTQGSIAQILHDNDRAISAYQISAQINPHSPKSWASLGLIYQSLGEIGQAQKIYAAGILHNSDHFGLYMNMGNLAFQAGEFSIAEEYYHKSLECQFDHCLDACNVFSNLSSIARVLGKTNLENFYADQRVALIEANTEEVISFYNDKEEQMVAGSRDYYLDMAICYSKLKQYEKLVLLMENMIQYMTINPESVEIIHIVIPVLAKQGYSRSIAQLIDHHAFLYQAHPAILNFSKKRFFSPFYLTDQDIYVCRQNFESALAALDQVNLDVGENLVGATQITSYATNFFLAYHGLNDLDVNQVYCQFVSRFLRSSLLDSYMRDLPIPQLFQGEKIKIAYVSAYFREHSGTSWLFGWMKNHDKSNFEVSCYHIDPQCDLYTERFKDLSDKFNHIITSWKEAAKLIKQDQLHVVIFTDIGMEPNTLLLCNLRLAPIQCSAWGHPVTSGSSQVDYYLSSEAMEPENAQEHYSETLVRLPKLGLCYEKRILPKLTKSRSDFDLPQDKIIYLSCQAEYKYLPQYDFIYPEIVKRQPDSVFLFIDRFGLGEKLISRISVQFFKYDLNPKNNFVLLSSQSLEDYLMLMMLVDVNLDTIGFSGGHTTFDAVACGLPTVTYPGEFMRGRQSYGILKVLGVEDTIASSSEQYIEIAARLGSDVRWREDIKQRMLERHDLLFEDTECIQALEKFLTNAVLNLTRLNP